MKELTPPGIVSFKAHTGKIINQGSVSAWVTPIGTPENPFPTKEQGYADFVEYCMESKYSIHTIQVGNEQFSVGDEVKRNSGKIVQFEYLNNEWIAFTDSKNPTYLKSRKGVPFNTTSLSKLIKLPPIQEPVGDEKKWTDEDMCQAFTAGQLGEVFLEWLNRYKDSINMQKLIDKIELKHDE